MAKRKQDSDNSSLELLLDTMCNTFGGIMFIAILLVVICSMSDFSKPVEKNTVPSKMTPQQIEELKARVKLKKSQLEKTMQKLKIPSNLVNSKEFQVAMEYNRLKSELTKSRVEHIILSHDLKKIQVEHDSIKQQTASEVKNIASLKKKIVKLKQINSQTMLKIKMAKNAPRFGGVTPPKQSSTNKKPVFAVLKNNRFFLLYKSPNISPVFSNQLNRNAFSDSFKLFFSDNKLAMRYAPIPGKGSSIEQNSQIKTVFNKVCAVFPNNKYFLSLAVHADSINLFIKIREYLHRNNLSYTWMPYMNDADLILSISNKVKYKSY